MLIKFFAFTSSFVYNTYYMAKRSTGVGNMKTTRSRKTAKRLAIKKVMLEKKAEKKCKK